MIEESVTENRTKAPLLQRVFGQSKYDSTKNGLHEFGKKFFNEYENSYAKVIKYNSIVATVGMIAYLVSTGSVNDPYDSEAIGAHQHFLETQEGLFGGIQTDEVFEMYQAQSSDELLLATDQERALDLIDIILDQIDFRLDIIESGLDRKRLDVPLLSTVIFNRVSIVVNDLPDEKVRRYGDKSIYNFLNNPEELSAEREKWQAFRGHIIENGYSVPTDVQDSQLKQEVNRLKTYLPATVLGSVALLNLGMGFFAFLDTRKAVQRPEIASSELS